MSTTTCMEKNHCPFWDSLTLSCQVSFSREVLSARRRLHYCMTDDHDNCPLYLAEALRRSRQRSTMHELTYATR